MKNISQTVFVYIGSFTELDPRLSEVHRWWMDKTSPNCEIIETPEKSEEVLRKFLTEKNIDSEYALTQKQLIDFMYVAEKKGIEADITQQLINRLPGLAQADTIDTGITYA